MIDIPSSQDLRRARDQFAHLLGRATAEAAWQRFFAANPYVLSRGLPLRLLPCDILPLGRPGRSEPDFLIHPGSDVSDRLYGVVELKTNFMPILTRPRKAELILSREAATAVSQVTTYDGLYDTFSPTRRILALESLSHLFIIMGQRRELEEVEETLLLRLKQIIPPGIRFMTFDDVYAGFERGIPKHVTVLERVPGTIERKTPLDADTPPSLIRILEALADGSQTGREIAARCALTGETVARQLNALRAAGLVQASQEGRVMLNTLSPKGAQALSDSLLHFRA